MKLGILGGTFNPIHYGHLAMARAAREAHGLDRVLLVPSGRPPHKARDLAPAADRLAMARLAVEGVDGLEVSETEVEREGISYTVETLEKLSTRYPDADLFFILGADSVPELRSWHKLSRILELARLVVVNRPGSPVEFRAQDFPGISRRVMERCAGDQVSMDPVPLSSTTIRRAVKRDEPLDGKVPPAVERYLYQHQLYR